MKKIRIIRRIISFALAAAVIFAMNGCSEERSERIAGHDYAECTESAVPADCDGTETEGEQEEAPAYISETGVELDFIPDLTTLRAETAAEEIPEHDCSYINYISSEPNCTEEGERVYECEICGKKLTETVPVKGHSYYLGVCTGCGKAEKETAKGTYAAEENEHKHSFTSETIKAAECCNNGLIKYSCSCGAWYEETISAAGHSFKQGKCTKCGEAESKKTSCEVHLFVTKYNKQPGCTESGRDVIVCINCGLEKDKNIPAKGHDFKNGVCTGCGAEEQGSAKEQTHTHSYNGQVTKEASCTQPGEKTYSCACGAYYTESIKASGHSFSNGKCTRCGAADSSVKTEKPAEHSHVWNGGTVTKEPTCCEYGIKTYSCGICGASKAETLALKDHCCSKSECCMYCGTKTHNHLDACGNYAEGVWTSEQVQGKTCSQDGIIRYTCIYCGMTGTSVEQAEHEIGDDGACIWCGYTNEDQWTRYGRQLANSGASGRQLCDSIAAYVASTGYGDCISFGSMCGLCADGAGIGWEWRSVAMVNCDGLGPDSGLHDPNTFDTGFCPYCGLGNNHHWVRLYPGDGCWYEYDCYAGDGWCVRGACTPRYGTR